MKIIFLILLSCYTIAGADDEVPENDPEAIDSATIVFDGDTNSSSIQYLPQLNAEETRELVVAVLNRINPPKSLFERLNPHLSKDIDKHPEAMIHEIFDFDEYPQLSEKEKRERMAVALYRAYHSQISQSLFERLNPHLFKPIDKRIGIKPEATIYEVCTSEVTLVELCSSPQIKRLMLEVIQERIERDIVSVNDLMYLIRFVITKYKISKVNQ